MMGLDSLACIDPSQKKEGTICFFKHCLGFFFGPSLMARQRYYGVDPKWFVCLVLVLVFSFFVFMLSRQAKTA